MGPRPGWSDAARVVGMQGLLAAALLGLLLVTPAGLALSAPALAAAALAGGWWWAVRVGRPRDQLETAAVRHLAARVGALTAPPLGLAYASIAAVPGQVDLPPVGIALVAVTVALAGGAAAAGLTACGLDLGRPAE